MKTQGKCILALLCLTTWGTFAAANLFTAPSAIALFRRGGATEPSDISTKKVSKKKKISKKKKTKSKRDTEDDKARINQSLKEEDAADALGNAIRNRAHQLRFGSEANPEVHDVERSLDSLGWALGSSDFTFDKTLAAESLENAGIEAGATSILAHYFLKSHGGAHALQSLLSLLASSAGIGAVIAATNQRRAVLSLSLMKRCMLFAMVKHVSGLLAATFMTARAIPDVGLRQARSWLEALVKDPVSQYLFYTACLQLWLPSRLPTSVDGKVVQQWWQSYIALIVSIVGPVVLREFVSTILVLSDILVLSTLSSSPNSGICSSLLNTGYALVDAGMSILVTPKNWREATGAQRQSILARLTSKVSLVFELVVGILMAADSLVILGAFTFGTQADKPAFLELTQRLACTSLYLHFLWTRKRKVEKLASSIRGGASQFPFYVLQVLTEPKASMGLSTDQPVEAKPVEMWNWKDYLQIALGFAEKSPAN
ncbi:hypothetical protein FisN_25Lh128 [Fistulifera solaris]|uniref:Protein RFT1 homolog n=1 Tax=Fistulifera solaris TaxID=1519565 RepID=A0A1Z5J7Q5_FISSO|nr:hypothetical protein FisN_25Lh128 [Fistulifera solaris]|eukprot:GAX10023.1 hypothetical protein FisN_25Lh128 [Fistulifera solaris]